MLTRRRELTLSRRTDDRSRDEIGISAGSGRWSQRGGSASTTCAGGEAGNVVRSYTLHFPVHVRPLAGDDRGTATASTAC